MRPPRALFLCLFLLVCCGIARGDEVHLTTGRTIKGTVVKETKKHVIVKTPKGKLTLPRHLVEKIVKQSKGKTYLELARQRVVSEDYEAAEKLFKKAAKDDDKDISSAAKRELAQLRKKMERVDSPVPDDGPDTDDADPPAPARRPSRRGSGGGGDKVSDLLLGGGNFARSVRAKEVVLALRADDTRKALSLLKAVKDQNAGDDSYRYLYGRALELAGKRAGANKVYLGLLKGTKAANLNLSVAWLGEAARRKLAGFPLDENSPGIGKAWKRIETKNFVIYHRFERVEAWFKTAPEQALKFVLETYKIKESEVEFSGRIQVFIFEDVEAYKAGGGMDLAGGHAQVRLAPDGFFKTISAYPERTFYLYTYRHEVAHTVLLEAYHGIPNWAHEGAAVWVEPARSRGRYRGIYRGQKGEGKLIPLANYLRDEAPRGATRLAVAGYYAYASTIFETLCQEMKSPRKALDVCLEIGQLGPEKALKNAGLKLDKFEKAMLALSKDVNKDR